MVHTIQGKQVGNIGFGLMGLKFPPGRITEEQAFATIKAALDAGCNYMNAGEFYGTPTDNTLTLLNNYYARYPEDIDKILLNVKGCVFENFRPECSPSAIRTSISNSVRMIGGGGAGGEGKVRINQFEPARKDPLLEIEPIVEALKGYVEDGSIGGIALSEVSAATIRRAAKLVRVEAVEVEISLWSTEPLENGVAEACAELDIPILAYSPLGRGMLTGQIKSFSDLPENDFRRLLPRFQPDVFEGNLGLVREVEKLAARKGCTPGQIAIGWVLAVAKRPGMPKIIPIPGASTPERVRENAVEIELEEADLVELERIMKEFAPKGERYHAHALQSLDNSTA